MFTNLGLIHYLIINIFALTTETSTKHDKNMYILLDGKLNSDFCLAISELRRERG